MREISETDDGTNQNIVHHRIKISYKISHCHINKQLKTLDNNIINIGLSNLAKIASMQYKLEK